MGGVPVARAASEDGRWAYTLYARRNHGPFVHALDTAEREAFCIDLPLRLAFGKQWTLRLRLHTPTELVVQLPGGGRVAIVDTSSWDVRQPLTGVAVARRLGTAVPAYAARKPSRQLG